MKKNNSAFTLIELLVVITIIAILASIALPVFNGVTERANQTKDLSNAKQIGLALKLFASDNNGFFPSKQPDALDYNAAPATLPTLSNQAFWWLFPNYLQSEDIFVVASSVWSPKNADNKLDAPGTVPPVETLKAGENNYAYVVGLSDTSNPAFPLIGDGFADAAIPTYVTNKSLKGGVWAAKKAIVIFADASGQIMRVDTTSRTVKRPTGEDLFAAGTDWLDATANPVINPQ
jgi:prepilin-type N-terminal cleavage/methylation domain-containing protein